MTSPSTPSGPPTSWRELLVAWRWPLALIAAVLIASGAGYLVYRETLHRAGQLAEKVEDVARRFWSGDVTQRFVSSLPEVTSAEGGRLELATLETTETFSRTDEQWIFWDLIPLGTVVSEIQVPVTYRYHLRLADPWRVEIEGGVCTVYAPRLRPSQPPAIHTDGMVKRTTEGWLRFDGAAQLAELERGLTPQLTLMASDPRRVDQVREASRRAVAEFVRTWLLREQQWGETGVGAIKVVFPDEAETADALAPTLTVKD